MLSQKNDSQLKESWQVPAMRTEQNTDYEKGEGGIIKYTITEGQE